MTFYKNPIFLGIVAFVIAGFYFYYDVKNKKELQQRIRNTKKWKNNKDVTVDWSEIPWLIPIIIGALTWITTGLYFGPSDKAECQTKDTDINMQQNKDDLTTFTSEITDEISENFKVPKAKRTAKIFTTDIGKEDALLELWQ